MTSLFRNRQSFLQTTGWQNQALNALHYNTAQQGSVDPIIYGTTRQQVNVIDLLNYMGPSGKKGKTGSLPITGTSRTGKGGGSSKGKGGKKDAHFTIDVMFAICQGPTFSAPLTVYSSSGVEPWGGAGLTFYNGADGQAADPVFSSLGHTVNYSGTSVIAGTPMDLGQSPVIPNLSFEQPGFLVGLDTGSYSLDANPGRIITDFLTNPRYGAEFPPLNLDTLFGGNTYGTYCQAAQLLVSVSLDGHQKALEWLDGLVKLTNSAMVFSGKLLKIIPYGDLSLVSNGATWDPNLVPVYSLTDNDFIPWHPHQDGSGPKPGEEDPILVSRKNSADAFNWYMIEYTDRANFYNTTTISVSDQGAIDQYQLRVADTIQGRVFCNQISAQISAQLSLQRSQYDRNTPYRFKASWRYILVEPMDIILLTGSAGDIYLSNQPVRILSTEEDENGDLIFEAEEIQTGTSAPPPAPGFPITIRTFAQGGRFLPASTSVGTGFVPNLQQGEPTPIEVGITKELIVLVVNRGTPTGTRTVTSLTDTQSLTWNPRWTYDTTDSNGLEWHLEEWWASTTSIVSNVSTDVTAHFSGTAHDALIEVISIQGPVNTAAPFDTNSSFPSKNNANLAAPAATGLTSNSDNILLIAWFMSTSSMTPFAFNSPTLPIWATNTNGVNYGPGFTYETISRQSQVTGVSSFVAEPFYTFPGGSPNVNPALDPYILVVDAVAGV